MKYDARSDERLKRIVSAFRHGLVLVDGEGEVVWMDRSARRRVDGQLQSIPLPLAKSDADSIDCFVSPVDVTINGERLTLGVIQETEVQKQGPDIVAAIESVLADSTSWFTRTIMDKVKMVSQVGTGATNGSAGNGSSQLDMLSAREREVLGLICEGRSDVQMAAMLGLSENTVRNHIAALYRKIGVNRRTAAVIWARERGITGRGGLTAVRAASSSRSETSSY